MTGATRIERHIDSYPCQRCGRVYGLDAVLPNEVWSKIAGGRWNLLCLWCIDDLCFDLGITASVSLHFAGRAVCGTSQSDADQEHISRLTDERHELQREVDRLRARLPKPSLFRFLETGQW